MNCSKFLRLKDNTKADKAGGLLSQEHLGDKNITELLFPTKNISKFYFNMLTFNYLILVYLSVLRSHPVLLRIYCCFDAQGSFLAEFWGGGERGDHRGSRN